MSRLAEYMQRLTGSTAQERGRTWQARLGDGLCLGVEDLKQLRSRYEVRPGPGTVTLGSLVDYPGDPLWVGLPVAEFSKLHGQLQGASGGGKSMLAISILATKIQSGQPVVLFDMKHETAEVLLNVLLPALAMTPGGKDLASTLRVIRPFDERWVPPLRITMPEDGVDREVQALSTLTSLEETSREAFPARMTRCALMRLSPAIEFNQPLQVLCEWLANPGEFARVAQGSSDPAVREYVRGELAREPAASLSAVITRLQNFLFLPQVRDALSTPTCVSFPEMLKSGITIIDLGDPPAGQERAAKFWAVLLLGRLIRAALNRPVDERTPPVTIVADEIQEALTSDVASMLQRMLSLARYRKVHLMLVNQASAQLSSVAPELMSSLRTNAGFIGAFRSNIEDARAIAPGFAISKKGMDGTQAQARMTQELTRLRNREYVLWLRQTGLPAMKLRSPRIDLDDLKRRAERCPLELRDAIQRGSVALDRAELRAQPKAPTLTLVENRVCEDATPTPAKFPHLG